MTLNQKDPKDVLGIFCYKHTPQLIKFKIPKKDGISVPALGGTGYFYLMHSSSHYKRVVFISGECTIQTTSISTCSV